MYKHTTFFRLNTSSGLSSVVFCHICPESVPNHSPIRDAREREGNASVTREIRGKLGETLAKLRVVLSAISSRSYP